ncbi:Alpha/beta hydrolase fold-1 [Amanita rubescens]|nr:Alpha/beta hydrolase fold-1 [Amanita rubescens]
MSDLQAKLFVFDCPTSTSVSSKLSKLKTVAKRYTFGNSADNSEGLTLLFAHCIGSHKEQWEPTINQIFHRQQHKDAAHRVREAWSFDWQNHGDAAVLNREALKSRPDGVCGIFFFFGKAANEWASAIAAFVRTPYMKDHRILLLGHSAGAAAVLISTKEFPIANMPFVGVVLIEPTMASKDVNTTSARRDTWRSRSEALAYFMKRLPWKTWDPRIDYGLEETGDGAKLKCDRRQEAVSYGDTEPHFEGATLITRLCHSLPIHLIFGARDDLVPDFIKDSLSDTSQGRFVASVSRVKHAGHMVREHATLIRGL